VAVVEQIRDVLNGRGIVVGKTRVVSVRTSLSQDANGEDVVIVKLVLSDPPAGEETWPIEDLWEIRRMTNSAIREVDPDLKIPWAVSFEPENPGELDPEDTKHEIQIDL